MKDKYQHAQLRGQGRGQGWLARPLQASSCDEGSLADFFPGHQGFGYCKLQTAQVCLPRVMASAQKLRGSGMVGVPPCLALLLREFSLVLPLT